jgi:hypothetical protein
MRGSIGSSAIHSNSSGTTGAFIGGGSGATSGKAIEHRK